MTWFKVDDGLHAHKKAIKAGIGAMGLWVLAGSWCADQLSDGFIPDYMALRMDLQAESHAAALVQAGLWEEDEVAGERGWRFHDWMSHQPSREQVEADREAARDRMRRRRAGKPAEPAQTDLGSREVRANAHGTSPSVRDPRPVPSRPVPTSTSRDLFTDADAPLNVPAPSAAAASSPSTPVAATEGFEAFWSAFPRKQGKGDARKAWTQKRCARHWRFIADAAARYAADPNREAQYTKLPAGWLREERWDDDALPPRLDTSRGGTEQARIDRIFGSALEWAREADAADAAAAIEAAPNGHLRALPGGSW